MHQNRHVGGGEQKLTLDESPPTEMVPRCEAHDGSGSISWEQIASYLEARLRRRAILSLLPLLSASRDQ